MENKTTEELRHEIKAAASIQDYLQNNKENLIQYDLPGHLNMLLSQKGLTKAEAVRGSLLSRAYVYQIFSGEKTPSRDTLLALAFSLHLTDTETQALLKTSQNRELYARDERDAIILYSLQHGMSILDANDLLYEHGFTLLCANS